MRDPSTQGSRGGGRPREGARLLPRTPEGTELRLEAAGIKPQMLVEVRVEGKWCSVHLLHLRQLDIPTSPHWQEGLSLLCTPPRLWPWLWVSAPWLPGLGTPPPPSQAWVWTASQQDQNLSSSFILDGTPLRSLSIKPSSIKLFAFKRICLLQGP